MTEKAIVRDYFNTLGFDRWRRIYGDGEVNRVQQDIRKGHARTIETVLDWLEDVKDQTVCDAGCGVGSLSIPLAQRGAQVFGSDLSEKMVQEARDRQQAELGQTENPQFSTSDLEAIQGSYDTVVCLDVMIHYPEADALEMIEHLTTLSTDRVIFSFAPKTPLLTILKKIGEFFPGPSKATRAYQHRETAIVERLQQLGWTVKRRETIKSQFYFAWILEVQPAR
ncbi:magnesium protoporphyrin IX methyltransferase [Synechococcus sp. PCC 7336]|uniref:magnesium protoporphyrin IX methyltransferase n=1 Tax=Synechococcus sp. PCC 7336 TaxID=195250 RepID=UPI0003471ED8|nr:magnesium protoporphyrin IX methyltransferase [Synechococcus sp. PCC 7336]